MHYLLLLILKRRKTCRAEMQPHISRVMHNKMDRKNGQMSSMQSPTNKTPNIQLEVRIFLINHQNSYYPFILIRRLLILLMFETNKRYYNR
jgi:hypothetical protein